MVRLHRPGRTVRGVTPLGAISTIIGAIRDAKDPQNQPASANELRAAAPFTADDLALFEIVGRVTTRIYFGFVLRFMLSPPQGHRNASAFGPRGEM